MFKRNSRDETWLRQ